MNSAEFSNNIYCICFCAIAALVTFLHPSFLLAQPNSSNDIFDEAKSSDSVLLYSGAILEGSVKEIERDGRQYFILTQEDGTQMKLDRRVVKSVRRPNHNYENYLQELAATSDSFDGHWRMQIWCRENTLPRQRQFHLRRIIELDPECAEARNLLGYGKFENQEWILRDHFFSAQGYVKYRNRWVLPQGIENLEAEQQFRELKGEWRQKIKRIRKTFMNENMVDARQQMENIQDPRAIAALSDYYDDEKVPQFRELIVRSLGAMQNSNAHRKLIQIYLNEPDGSVQDLALTMLSQDHFDPVVTTQAMFPFMNPSDSTSPELVRRAGFMIGVLGQEVAIRPLIDGLNTTHRIRNPRKQQGNTNVGFDQDGNVSRFQNGDDQPEFLQVNSRNETVLRALQKISGKSFDYDEQPWIDWFTSLYQMDNVDLRRDD